MAYLSKCSARDCMEAVKSQAIKSEPAAELERSQFGAEKRGAMLIEHGGFNPLLSSLRKTIDSVKDEISQIKRLIK